MNYMKTEPIKITIEGGFRPDKTIHLTLGPDANIEDWIETFKTILFHQTFDETIIKEVFETCEYNECLDELEYNNKDLEDRDDINISCYNEWLDEIEYDISDLEDRDDINISCKSSKLNWKTEF